MSNPHDPSQQQTPAAQIDWSDAPRQRSQGRWQGPEPFASPAAGSAAAAPSSPADPWVPEPGAQTAQEVADQWQAAQPSGPAADHRQQPAADPYQAPAVPVEAPADQSPAVPAETPADQSPAVPVEAPADQSPAVREQTPAQPAPPTPAAEPGAPEVTTGGSPAGTGTPDRDEPEALTIGRGRDNTIVLDDMLVSRRHVRITADSDGLVLEDLGSRNGTYVNGRRVERTHLSEGDRIGIGAATFEVRDGWLLNV